MTTYPEEFKARIIAQMLPPNNRHVPELARETGVPQDTLYDWRVKHRPKAEGAVVKAAAGPDRLTSQEKFHLVVESAPLNEQELGEFCRNTVDFTLRRLIFRIAPPAIYSGSPY